MGGATTGKIIVVLGNLISIHAPRGGERPASAFRELAYCIISIHAPRGGSDPHGTVVSHDLSTFQSTLPVGGATICVFFCSICVFISIHAPRGGSDGAGNVIPPSVDDFNPRSPWGERLCHFVAFAGSKIFQSTLPVGGATGRPLRPGGHHAISIHAPRGGSDDTVTLTACGGHYFNPRSPWGERLRLLFLLSAMVRFQSTLPVGGATVIKSNALDLSTISIHAPRGGSDRRCAACSAHRSYFNPRSPWGERPGRGQAAVCR